MSDDLIERLLDVWQNTTNDEHADIIHEAADRIDQLEAQLAVVKKDRDILVNHANKRALEADQ